MAQYLGFNDKLRFRRFNMKISMLRLYMYISNFTEKCMCEYT